MIVVTLKVHHSDDDYTCATLIAVTIQMRHGADSGD